VVAKAEGAIRRAEAVLHVVLKLLPGRISHYIKYYKLLINITETSSSPWWRSTASPPRL
jgi:hypothetical protein